MQVLLDPTDSETTILIFGKSARSFPHTKKDAGAGIIELLFRLKLGEQDELQVVTGPGNFTAVRTIALIANTVAWLTGSKLFARRKDTRKFRRVKFIQPYYTLAPRITLPK